MQSSCPYYYSRVVVNPRIAMFWPCAVRPAARTNSKRTPSNKRKDRRFEYLIARYYRGVCTFASRRTDEPLEAALLTHAAFTGTRKVLRSRDEVRRVRIPLTVVMRAAQVGKLCGANWATRVHANKPIPEPKNPRCPICLEGGRDFRIGS
jgi:hypothetical protein